MSGEPERIEATAMLRFGPQVKAKRRRTMQAVFDAIGGDGRIKAKQIAKIVGLSYSRVYMVISVLRYCGALSGYERKPGGGHTPYQRHGAMIDIADYVMIAPARAGVDITRVISQARAVVADIWCIGEADLDSGATMTAGARAAWFWLVRNQTGLSYVQLALAFGRVATTIEKGCRSVAARCESEPEYRRLMEMVIAAWQQTPGHASLLSLPLPASAAEPPEEPTSTRRACLTCAEPFWSAGPHNRMCSACRRDPMPRAIPRV